MKLMTIILFGLALSVFPVKENNQAVDPSESDKYKNSATCYMENNTFKDGERFVLKVYYHWTAMRMNAGEVVFKVNEKTLNNKPVYHIVANGQTYRSYEWFYRVRDQYETYIDKTTMQPYKFVRDVDEGGYIIKNIYDFDHDKNIVHTQDLVKQPVKKDSFAIPNCVHDIVSAIYFSRNIDYNQYKPNDKIPLSIFIDGEVYNMYVRYMGKEIVKTKLGKFRTIKFRPLLLDNEYFEGGEEMTLWVTDDKNKIPVRIETPVTVGSIRADLLSYSGLKYKFDALVK